MDENIVEPSGRFKRGALLLRTDSKFSYRAIDQSGSTPAIWNEYLLEGSTDASFQNLKDVITYYAQSAGKKVKPYTAWIAKKRNTFVIIMQLFSSQKLGTYLQSRGESLPRAVISDWCRQIIREVEQYSAYFKRPHGALRCSNVYIEPSEGIVNIGLPNVAMILSDSFGGQNDSRIDVLQLGNVVIEMATGKSPELDESRLFQNYVPPEISDISDPVIADFITTCTLPIEQRPTMAQLKDHILILDDMSNAIGDRGGRREPDINRIMNTPEFKALLERQRAEMDGLILQQKKERKEKRKQIRETNQKKQSLRELLKEYPSS